MLLQPSDVIQAFVRDVLLTGNGTLFVNNTFVEWAAVQALRRAQPRMLVTRYGVRDKLKPFSSLLLFSQPRSSDQIPLIEDPVGSFIDVEQLSYYVLGASGKERRLPERRCTCSSPKARTSCWRSARTARRPLRTELPRASLSDVCATMAAWLGVPAPTSAGQPIAPLIGD